jgi:hypothetical protein
MQIEDEHIEVLLSEQTQRDLAVFGLHDSMPGTFEDCRYRPAQRFLVVGDQDGKRVRCGHVVRPCTFADGLT